MKVVFQNANGFVTDSGGPVVVLADRNERMTIPRYGIWQKCGRPIEDVVKLTASLEEAKRFLENPE